jgi:hypothetical protein
MDAPSTSISDNTQKLVGLMAQCCVDLKRQPVDLRYGDFKKWLKKEFKLLPEDQGEVEAYIASVGGFIVIRNAFFSSAPSIGSIEKAELKSFAKLGRVANEVLANQDLFLKRFEERFQQMLDKHATFKPFGYAFKQRGKVSPRQTNRVLNLALSDLHFGTWLDPREVPYRYGFEQEARRLASVIKRTCEFKRDYRAETELVVWLGGDLIAGIIHDVQAHLSLAEQVGDAVWLLRQAINILAGEFKKVTVFCSTGNHDRNTARHQDRATAGKWDSFATHIYIALKAASAHLPNVQVIIPRTPHVEHEPFGDQRIYLTHGDTCINAGNPGKSINIHLLESQMLRVNGGEVARGKKPYGLFVVGHVHTGSLTHLAPGTLITNGCLIPPDPFAVSVGYTAVKNGQQMWETTRQRLVGDSRFLEVDETVDQDASLDALIVPWDGNF